MGSDRAADRVTAVSIALSVLLLAALVAAYVLYDSTLALAQAADSLVDVGAAGVLWWAVRVSAKPPDAEHPFGHHSAEPLAALLVAMLAGTLAFEVGQGAIAALFGTPSPILAWPLAAAFALKVVAKVGLFSWSRATARRLGSPALFAIAVDSRNDVLVGVLGIAGFFGARAGWPALDAWLALPVALWVGWSGVALGLENVRLLMGHAPDEERQDELTAIARSVDGVQDAVDLQARSHGTQLDLWIEVRVDGGLSVQQGHDIGERVEARLLEEDDVARAVAHVDVA